MEDEWLRWLGTTALALLSTMVATAVGVFKALGARITKVHARIDDVKDKYVRRDDLDGHLRRLENGLSELRNDMKEQNAAVIAAITENRDK